MDTRLNRDTDPLRLYGIIRGDLEMTPGKLCAQLGHAYLDAFLAARTLRPDTIDPYKTLHGIKIAMKAKSLMHLEEAHEKLVQAGIPCALITDLGYYGTREDLLGKPTITALGVGPARRGEIEKIFHRFRLMD
jgi:peptidyl-tRNA hydrolase